MNKNRNSSIGIAIKAIGNIKFKIDFEMLKPWISDTPLTKIKKDQIANIILVIKKNMIKVLFKWVSMIVELSNKSLLKTITSGKRTNIEHIVGINDHAITVLNLFGSVSVSI